MEARTTPVENRVVPRVLQAGEPAPPPAPDRSRPPHAPESPGRRRPGLY
jgi:hypothetical protein